MSRILVTGASGFLGSAVVSQLQEAGVQVRGTGRRPSAQSCSDYWPADLRHASSLPEMLRDVSCIVHCAGLAHQFQSRPDAAAYDRINSEATERLARFAAEQGVQRFVFVSSVSVYGPSTTPIPRDEETLPAPMTPYAKSKRQAELRLLRLAEETGLQVIILRLATLYGEHDPGNVQRLLEALKRGRFAMVGRGENQKSLLHRDDAAAACVRAAIHASDRPTGIWNVAAGSHSMREIVDNLAIAAGVEPPRHHLPAALVSGLLQAASVLSIGPIRRWAKSRYATVRKWLAEDAYDGSRFARDFDWQPQISLEEGFRRQALADQSCSLNVHPTHRAA